MYGVVGRVFSVCVVTAGLQPIEVAGEWRGVDQVFQQREWGIAPITQEKTLNSNTSGRLRKILLHHARNRTRNHRLQGLYPSRRNHRRSAWAYLPA